MLTFFNRRELLTTYSLERQAQVRDLLSANGIAYTTRTVNANSTSALGGGRARTGTFGQNMQLAYQYLVYVHKNDYERARHLIGK